MKTPSRGLGKVAAILLAVCAGASSVAVAALKIENLKNDKATAPLSAEAAETAVPKDRSVTPEQLERAKQRFHELYPDAIAIPPDQRGALGEIGKPEPVDDPGASSPYWSTGKLTFVEDGTTKRCTAQFVDTNVILTAAHCVYDFDNQAWNSNFTFWRAFDRGTAEQEVGWRCISIYREYHGDDENFALDYAFILTDVADDKTALSMRTGSPPTKPLTTVGYPRNFGDGKRLYGVDGEWGSVDRGIVTMTGNPMRGGNSGGAWFSEFEGDGGTGKNLVFSLNSHHLEDNNTDENGPLFTVDTETLRTHVRDGGCLN